MDCLPDEFWAAEILWRLPVKSIIQCRCVCKLWCSLITAPKFISKYVVNNTKTLNPQTFMHQADISKIKSGNCLLLFDNNEDHLRPMLLHLTCPSASNFVRIVGSVNGLICISISQGDVHRAVNFILFNPSIGRFLSIPPLPILPPADTSSTFFQTVKGLGFDETTHDYKILYIVLKKDCFVYSLNSNRWRTLVTPPIVTGTYSSFFVNGRIHWLAVILRNLSCINLIMFFDVKDETFGDISLPNCMESTRFYGEPPSRFLSMAEFGESSVAVISERLAEHVCDIWVMKEYGSVESWIKLATLHSKVRSKVLGFRNKEEVLARKFGNRYGCIVSRNINNSGKKDPVKILMNLDHQIPYIFNYVYKYVPSLVLLNKEKNFDAAIEKNFDAAMDVTSDFELRRSKRARKVLDRYH